MLPVDVRERLVDALRLDLVGPGEILGAKSNKEGQPNETLPQPPSTWYLTGFLVPLDAAPEQRIDHQADEEIDELGDTQGFDDAVAPEPAAARVRYLPSSMGVSLLIPADARTLTVVVRWGDYERQGDGHVGSEPFSWERTANEQTMTVEIPEIRQPREFDVPQSGGLRIAVSVRRITTNDVEGGLPQGTRSMSVFLVNRRVPQPDADRDHAFAFQTQLEIRSESPFVPRPNLRSLESQDYDERVADLQYRDACEFAVGHSVAAEALIDKDDQCRCVRTRWIPQAEVERVAPTPMDGVELSMDALAGLRDFDEARQKLGGLVTSYETWIGEQRSNIQGSTARRTETASLLLQRAHVAADRIQKGIALLADPLAFEAFRIANRAMAASARQRFGVMQEVDPATVEPTWRPFQLAFVLMNLAGIAQPTDSDRDVVDLLFFPTGGGKTEAYLGLAAFTLVYRRLKYPGIASAGLSVLMRYTLRLLTLDQLSRAATLICALELERQQDAEKLGDWPFEIGLWVGKAATPNVMGSKGVKNSDSARERTIAFKNDDRKPSPIPLEECPWCGRKFVAASFQLLPDSDHPIDLRVTCANRHCEYSRDNPLPILAVDEPIYRRLPCFMIATVDKFAAMPWTGGVGQLFGRVSRCDRHGFYGPCDPTEGMPIPSGELLPPDLIIQDELHLISGPLGTIVGIYECAIDELCTRTVEGNTIRPKIVASTATVRKAEDQIRAIFNRHTVDIFPPPGPDRRDSFFAETHSPLRSHARWYVGIAAQGRSPKVVMLRVYLALLAAAQKEYLHNKKRNGSANPADPYMTLLGYFNSLRELGGARRLVEDEVRNRVAGYGKRVRVGESKGLFADRTIAYEPVELTSRVSTAKVAEAKRRLSLPFSEKDHVDVAIATNMISVGLDIVRLGLMVVFGQPKTSAEYIQATSRVGRDHERPGLVVTIFNIHKPRDRSHYERFVAYHQSFYRAVEATSVTPFSPRALDRGLAGTLVALSRQGHAPMTPAVGAHAILQERAKLDFAVQALSSRAESHARMLPEEAERLRERIRERSEDLLDEWTRIAKELDEVGGTLQYQVEVGSAQRLLYEFLNPELRQLHMRYRKFRANRSMRDVEPSVNLWIKTTDNVDVPEEEDRR